MKNTEDALAYVCCTTSGCGVPGGGCLLKVHVKDGKVRAIEKGDSLNQGMPHEDLDDQAIKNEMVQNRPCSRAYLWRKTVHHKDRALYPAKRVGPKGEHKFERISWDEALDTVAAKINEIGEKYGPYCILGEFPLLQWVAPWGFKTWGTSSRSGYMLPDLFTLGHSQGHIGVTDSEAHEFTDIFNTKLIIWLGNNPAVTEHGSALWYLRAKKKGIPIIVVDPVYSITAEVYADQWIPIRPNTDIAMLLAMANVLIKENLYDADYVSKHVELAGFAMFKDYVLGLVEGPDGKMERSPEWAEKICGVPAETIRELTRLYARSKPCYFSLHRSATRQLYGENAGRAAIYLQAMTGNLGIAGGSPGCDINCADRAVIPTPKIDWKSTEPKYTSKYILWKRAWVDSILMREKLEKGEIDEDEYRRRCGIIQGHPLPNIRMAWLPSEVYLKYQNYTFHRCGRPTLGNQDQNSVIRAIKKQDFVVAPVYFMTNPNTFFADVILPLADPFFEEPRGFVASGCASNFFVCGFKAIEPPGEARPMEWIIVQLAKRLGVAEQYSPRLADVVDDYPKGWDDRMIELFQDAYERWAGRPDVQPRNPPKWEDFKKSPLYRVPFEQKPNVAFAQKIEKLLPFDTPSGKIEFQSAFLSDPEMARKTYTLPQRKIEEVACFGGSVPPVIPPLAQWMLPPNNLLAAKAKTYPLTMLTSHSFHRQHTSQDNNPWNRDEFRHAVHISAVDAKARGIKDGDKVHVFNENGELILPAYVTSRVTPGVVLIRHGAWPEPSEKKTELMPEGIDQRGADNFLTSSNYYPWVVGAIRCSELVQVEKSGV